jgi:hypothetical protein
MKITLKRKVELKSAVVYLKIQTEAQREDIKNYLESDGGFPNPVIERRVKNYLRDRGIYNSGYQLTAKGDKVKDTGMIEEPEEGKYQIWYTLDDPLFGNRIFYFRRIKPDTRSNPQLEPLGITLDKKTFVSLPIQADDTKEPVKFSVPDSVDGYKGENRTVATINCEWIWDNMETSFFLFSGKFSIDDIDNKKEMNEKDFNIDFNSHISTVMPDWNEKTGRCKLKLENIKTNENDVYQYFEYSGQRNCEGFDSCYYDKLPVEPYNPEEAHIWRNRLLNGELEKQYMYPGDFISNVIAINQKEGFTTYAYQLDIPDDIHQYISAELEQGKKSGRGAAYWHLAAPFDLNVEIPQSLKLSVISFAKGEYIGFQEFTAKFNCEADIKEVFYYDKYIINYYQQRSVAAFLKAFGIPKMLIVTDKNAPDFNDCLSKYDPQIAVKDILDVFQNRKGSEHDRFLVFKSGGNLTVWTSTNSIDYIRFNCKGAIQLQEKGIVEKSITYSRVRTDILGTQLKNYILNEERK